jgi:histidyl-tRNA synthetase
VFEWVSGDLGSQNAICGGGRYDRLFEEIGGADTAAVGFSAGIERIAAVLLANGQETANATADVYVVAVGDGPRVGAHRIAEQLRDGLPGLRIVVDAASGSFKAKFRRADRSGAAVALVLGDDELAAGCVQIKSMHDNTQQQVTVEHAVMRIKELLAT